ncbi:protocatechuate 3,4-dioxygenase subunit beta [Planosporangium mesophilum]|uniref:Protocatechuate 3,4-dioxygenase subunit beta n=1 Tax=Planosporangium mesophilum TaxID=689768 RepID=A0A8J3TGP6_9ACTN|nr:protocatechuate 3,4-dioxygenase subunit beta [Planosporangium mesophilum]GII25944.1 protocatechuate 3,4-dioxygenase subunit beta [Planosporangium mesophilum]
MTESVRTPSGLLLPRYERPLGVHPELLSPEYRSTVLRAPSKPLVLLPHNLTEITGPLLGSDRISETDNDLTRQHDGEPVGQRIIVHGRVLDSDGRPVPDTLLEIWQANASGRYKHVVDDWPGPLDPNFTGVGRTVTDSLGRYRFTTVRPGAYPWKNHHNAWRPAHIHFSLFGRAFTQRLVTQMYFPDDPLHQYDPMLITVRDEKARNRLISRFDMETTEPEWALAYEFDIVLRGSDATPMEDPHDDDDE